METPRTASRETVIDIRDGAGVSEDFEMVALKPRSYNELEFDAGAEPGALNAECGLGVFASNITIPPRKPFAHGGKK